MASINENLFTLFGNGEERAAFGRRLLSTRFGDLWVGGTGNRVSALAFASAGGAEGGARGTGSGRSRADRAFRERFERWVDVFQKVSPEDRWALLAPAGTSFQCGVWRALLEVAAGTVTTYSDLARSVGRPRAHRAVGAAVGANPVALLLPCHRVVPKSGGVGGYRWGAGRKRALLDAEAEAGSGAASLLFCG